MLKLPQDVNVKITSGCSCLFLLQKTYYKHWLYNVVLTLVVLWSKH